ELVHRRLRQEGRGDIRIDGPGLELLRQGGREYEPTDADARGDRLRERGRVDDVRAALELEEQRRCFALEADEPVRVVLENGELVLARKLGDPLTPPGRERAPARILERRDRVEERGLVAVPERLLERVGIEPLVVDGQRLDLGA